MDTKPMSMGDSGKYACVIHPAAGCLHSPSITISDWVDGVWVSTGTQYSSAHRDCFEAYEAEQVAESAVYIQQAIEEMSLVAVHMASEESMQALGNVTLRDLMQSWLDNLHDDQHAGGDHEAEIARITALLALM